MIVADAPEGLKELVNQFFSNDYEVYVSEQIQIEGWKHLGL